MTISSEWLTRQRQSCSCVHYQKGTTNYSRTSCSNRRTLSSARGGNSRLHEERWQHDDGRVLVFGSQDSNQPNLSIDDSILSAFCFQYVPWVFAISTMGRHMFLTRNFDTHNHLRHGKLASLTTYVKF